MGILSELEDWLRDRKRVTFSQPLDYQNIGLDRNIKGMTAYLHDDGNLEVQPVIVVSPSGTKYTAQRAVYSDRNGVCIPTLYQATDLLDNFGWIQVIHYDVPANRNCMLETIVVEEERTTIATVIGDVICQCLIRHATIPSVVLQVSMYHRNVAFDYEHDHITCQIPFFAGDSFEVWIMDSAQQGTVTWQIFMKGTEYDA